MAKRKIAKKESDETLYQLLHESARQNNAEVQISVLSLKTGEKVSVPGKLRRGKEIPPPKNSPPSSKPSMASCVIIFRLTQRKIVPLADFISSVQRKPSRGSCKIQRISNPPAKPGNFYSLTTISDKSFDKK
jgi:hypothetical protein